MGSGSGVGDRIWTKVKGPAASPATDIVPLV